MRLLDVTGCVLLLLETSQLGGYVADDVFAGTTEVAVFPVVRLPLGGSRVVALFVALTPVLAAD